MLRAITSVLVFSALLCLGACCCPESRPGECQHHIEPPFEIQGGHTAAGLVYGTADFNGAGSVVIKVQVEDQNSPVHLAKVTVWSGTTIPSSMDSTVPPPGDNDVYSSGGDVAIRFWTTHLDRACPVGSQYYWLFVRVDYRQNDGSYTSKCFFNSWTPAAGPADAPHDFSDLGVPHPPNP